MAKKRSEPAKPAKEAAPRAAGKAPTRRTKADRLRAIDQSSVTSLILAKIVNQKGEKTTEEITKLVMGDLKESVTFHVKQLEKKKLLAPATRTLAAGRGSNPIRMLVCEAMCPQPSNGISGGEVTDRVMDLGIRGLSREDIGIVLEELRGGSSDCVRYQDRRYIRNCRVACTCD